jgi:TonB family protein
MKKITFLLLFFFLSHTLFAQYPVETDPATGKKGIVNPYNGEIIVPFEYDEIFNIPGDSIHIVKKNTRYGAIDEQNQLFIPMEFGMISFLRGRQDQPYLFAKVFNQANEKNKWGLINRKGDLILPMQYEEISVVYPDLLVARVFRDSVLHFYDGKGRHLYDNIGRTANPGFDENTVEIIRDRSNRYYNIKKNGDTYFDDRFEYLSWTNGDLVICGVKGKMGLINLRGDTILPFQYLKISSFDDGNFLVESPGDLNGLANSEGIFLFPLAKQSIQKWQNKSESVYTIRREGQRYMDLVDRYGKLIVADCKVQFVSTNQWGYDSDESKWDYMKVGDESTGKYGLYRSDGTCILPIEFDDIRYFNGDRPILVTLYNYEDYNKNRMSAYDLAGNKLLPDRFRTLYYTRNPRILIANENQHFYWGFVHLDKPEEAKFIYDGISDLGNGYYTTKNGNDFELLEADFKALEIEKFTNITAPVRQHFDQFRLQRLPGKLIAIGYRPQAPTSFAINHKGKSFPFEPLQPKKTGIDLSNTGTGSVKQVEGMVMEKVVEAVVEQMPPPPSTIKPNEGDFVLYPQKRPAFPGGEPALFKYIDEHLQYPEIARENKITGIVIVTFDIEKDGSLSNIRVTKDIGGNCGKEAMRIVRTLPKWIPAEHDGRKVKTFFDLPVTFTLK